MNRQIQRMNGRSRDVEVVALNALVADFWTIARRHRLAVERYFPLLVGFAAYMVFRFQGDPEQLCGRFCDQVRAEVAAQVEARDRKAPKATEG